MGKCFLSHSSFDKNYVGKVFERLGYDKAVYDQFTFETGIKPIDEIFKGISHSDIFVFFISEKSLESKWVKTELAMAKEKLIDFDAKLKQIYPIIVDETINYSDKRIPNWLRKGKGSYTLRYRFPYCCLP